MKLFEATNHLEVIEGAETWRMAHLLDLQALISIIRMLEDKVDELERRTSRVEGRL